MFSVVVVFVITGGRSEGEDQTFVVSTHYTDDMIIDFRQLYRLHPDWTVPDGGSRAVIMGENRKVQCKKETRTIEFERILASNPTNFFPSQEKKKTRFTMETINKSFLLFFFFLFLILKRLHCAIQSASGAHFAAATTRRNIINQITIMKLKLYSRKDMNVV